MANQLPHTRRPRFGIQLVGENISWPEFRSAARAIESFGFDTLWNHDHLLPVFGDRCDPVFETLTTLTAMALSTSRIRIGTLVNGVMYRTPAILAKQAAMLDVLSEGRLEFALGASWAAHEFQAYGMPFPSAGERVARLDEALQIVRALWTGEVTTVIGRYYQVTEACCAPKPVQAPHPPIMVGGGGEEKTLRVVARHADIWGGEVGPEACRRKIGLIRQYCAEIGRDPAGIEMSVHPALAIAPTVAAARAKAQATAQRRRQPLERLREDGLFGTPEEIVERLHAYMEAGVTNWVMAMVAPFDLDQARLFAEKVIPAFR
jgi:F420-dependent oxidoreductase-like protein